MHLKTMTVVLVAILFIGQVIVLPVTKVEARANINEYLNQMHGAPNGFEPSGWNTPGTATWLDVQLTAGWKHMTVMGNLGIGDGSIATFGDKDSLPANQSDPYFMGADVSQQPIDPIRALNLNVSSPAIEEKTVNESNNTTENETAGNSTDASSMPPFMKPPELPTLQPPADPEDNETESNKTAANETAIEVTSSETTNPGMTPENLTYTTYHPNMIGAPANDLLYEHPLATSVSMYCRLIGLETSTGPINIGMKCLGYGY